MKTKKSQEGIEKALVNKCTVSGCLTNHANGEKGTVFDLPKDKDQQIKQPSSLNRNDLETQKHVFACYKHFANHLVKKNNHRHRLICSMNPFPTILPASQSTTNVSEAERERLNTNTSRKPLTARVLRQDELQIFKQMDTIGNLEEIDDICIKSLGDGFTSLNRNGHLIIFRLETNISNVPEVTHCIDFSTDLRVKLYFKNVTVPLPEWLIQGRNTFLTSKPMIVYFISYLNEGPWPGGAYKFPKVDWLAPIHGP